MTIPSKIKDEQGRIYVPLAGPFLESLQSDMAIAGHVIRDAKFNGCRILRYMTSDGWYIYRQKEGLWTCEPEKHPRELKTHCPHGHLYTRKRGKPAICMVCKLEWKRRRRSA